MTHESPLLISNYGVNLVKSLLISSAAKQYKWLERDLANVDRSMTPWLVAAWHPPWYNTYTAHYKEAECMRLEMEELLYSYGVDIVFNGHVSHENQLWYLGNMVSRLKQSKNMKS